MRVGLYGGTFNPVHKAHLKIARDVLKDFNLDKVFLIPCAVPPHKGNDELADPVYRYEMLKIATDGEKLVVSDAELKRSGPSYTIDTVKEFLTKGFDDVFFMIGTDAFLELDLWKSFEAILKKISFIIMKRPSETEDNESVINFIESKLGDFKYIEEEYCFKSEIYKNIYLSEVTQLDISSTMIRNSVKQNKKIDHLVGKKVENYIIEKGLYL